MILERYREDPHGSCARMARTRGHWQRYRVLVARIEFSGSAVLQRRSLREEGSRLRRASSERAHLSVDRQLTRSSSSVWDTASIGSQTASMGVRLVGRSGLKPAAIDCMRQGKLSSTAPSSALERREHFWEWPGHEQWWGRGDCRHEYDSGDGMLGDVSFLPSSATQLAAQLAARVPRSGATWASLRYRSGDALAPGVVATPLRCRLGAIGAPLGRSGAIGRRSERMRAPRKASGVVALRERGAPRPKRWLRDAPAFPSALMLDAAASTPFPHPSDLAPLRAVVRRVALNRPSDWRPPPELGTWRQASILSSDQRWRDTLFWTKLQAVGVAEGSRAVP